jgi:hypothetical protein
MPRKAFCCFAFCSIGSMDNKTLWVTLSYSVSCFVLLFPVWKLIGHGNPGNNLESSVN